MRRPVIILGPLLLLAAAAMTWWWALYTESGAHWVWARLQSIADDNLQAQELRGDLASGLTIQQLEYSSAVIRLEAARLRVSVDVDLFPPQIRVYGPVVDDVRVHAMPGGDSREPADIAVALEAIALPVPVKFTDLMLRDVIVDGMSGDDQIVISEVGLSGRWHDAIDIDQLNISTPDIEAMMTASLDLNRPFATAWQVNAELGTRLTRLPDPLSARASATGDLRKLSIIAESQTYGASAKGSVSDLLDSPTWDLRAEGLLSIADLSPAEVIIEAAGDTNGISIHDLIVEGIDARLRGSGHVTWGDDWTIQSQLNVDHLNLNPIIDSWPADQPLHGGVSLELNDRFLEIRDTRLDIGTTDMSFLLHGQVDLASAAVNGGVGWENLRWPIADEQGQVSSRSGNVSVEGVLDDWRVTGQLDVSARDLPSGEFRVDGSGDRHHIEAAILESAVLGGRVSGSASYNWRESHHWAAEIDIGEISVGSVSQLWPGIISGRVNIDGTGQPFSLDLEMIGLEGEIQDRPLAANGRVVIAEHEFRAVDLNVSHGGSTVAIDGNLYAVSGVAFDASVDEFSTYIWDAAGAFSANGSLSLNEISPHVRVTASSDKISYREFEVTNVDVRLAGDRESQRLQFAAMLESIKTNMLIEGNVDDWRDPERWVGQLTHLVIESDDAPPVQLTESTSVEFSPDFLNLGRACLAADNGMNLCADVGWRAEEFFRVRADLSRLPANLVNLFTDTGLVFDQSIDGELDWLQESKAGRTASVDIRISPGMISSVDDRLDSVATGEGRLAFEIAGEQLSSGIVELPMFDFGHVSGLFTAQEADNFLESPIHGEFDAELADVEFLTALLPQISDAHGSLRVNLLVDGTISDRSVSGDASMSDASFDYLPVGLRINKADLSALLHTDGQIELSGAFNAGDGRAEITTRADSAKTGAKGVEVEIRGQDLTLINLPNIQARTNLDVRVAFANDHLTLGGRVQIDHARITPSDLTIAQDSVSEDVVIVAGVLPDDETELTPRGDLQLDGSLEVVLGDDISVDLGVAVAKVSGATVFTWTGEPIPMASGYYDLTGQVQAFGQVLEITEGGVRFPEVPANNPRIRLRAERQIYGNPQVRTAGILISGSVRRPNIEAYTNPRTTRERALTLLVTGSDFNFEQGVGAIDFGTYIAPRLFVSYGVGVFEEENIFRVRYDLKRGFGVTISSGQKEGGVDLNYSIDR